MKTKETSNNAELEDAGIPDRPANPLVDSEPSKVKKPRKPRKEKTK